MSEGLSAAEVGQEIAGHAKHAPHERRDRLLSIVEAVLLSCVALLAAWSGYAAAKWSTESRLNLAEAATARVEANRADLDARELKNYDSSTFESWFAAYAVGNREAMRVAEKRFRPEFGIAFDAWRAARPAENPSAPDSPTDLPQYNEPGITEARALDKQATEKTADGSSAAGTADDYVRATLILAVVLFLVGISAHFPLRAARYGLIALGAVLLVASIVQVARLPRPPT